MFGIIEFIEQIDQQVFLFLNAFHSPFWDSIMYWISYKFTWIPVYLAIFLYLIYNYKKQSILIIALLIASIAIADSTSVHFFKNIFLRYRPCHNLDLQKTVHIVRNHCGGQYGFISSHASNVFAFAILSAWFIRIKWASFALILWAVIVSYSRIYLGVHYPADIFVGAIWGSSIAIGIAFLYQKYLQNKF